MVRHISQPNTVFTTHHKAGVPPTIGREEVSRTQRAPETTVKLPLHMLCGRMRKATGYITVDTIEQTAPFTGIASIAPRILGAAGYAVACKPLWENALGEFVIWGALNGYINVEMTLDKETLKLHGRQEIRRFEKYFNFLANLGCFINAVEVLVPVLCRIGKQMMVLDSIFGCRGPMLCLFR